MKKNCKRVKLFVEYAYSQIMFLMLFVIGMIILLYVCFSPASSCVVEILWISISCIILIISLIGSVVSCQIAFLTMEGILFQIAFLKIKLIKWSELIDIAVRELPTYRSTMKEFYKKWIVFYTIESQEAINGGENRKNNQFPGQIKYTSKNISLLFQFCEKNHLNQVLGFIDNIWVQNKSK